MSVPIVNIGQNTCDCLATACSSGLSATLVCDDFPDSYGPHYVKVYLWFVVPPNAPNAFEDPLDARAATIWANLRSAFSDHHIFFVPGFVGCGPSDYYDIIDSEDIGEEVPPTTAGVENLRGLGFMHTDGIDAYIFRDDVTNGQGSSFCIPSTYFFVVGEDPSPNANHEIHSKTQTVSHEMGHCLGLLHTDNTGAGNDCEDTDGSDCQHKGDLVCDTPPDNSQYNANGTCDPSPLPPQDFTNIMCGFKPPSCLDHFTSGQGRRMRRYLKQPVGDMDKVLIQDIVITGQVTWNAPISPGANIIIEPGGHLTIDATVTMQEGAHIYVKPGDEGQNKPGGLLSVKRTVTAACGKMWQGIIVDGHDNRAQTNQYQGKVFIYGAGVVEHARCGVLVNGIDEETGKPLPYATGGIVSVQYPAVFRNNIVDVQFGSYKKEYVASYFSGAQFITDDDYRGNVAPVHLKLNGVYGLRIIGGQFRDDRTDLFSDPASRAVGLDAYDSGFRVYGSAHFTGLYEGVHVSTVNDLEGTSVTGAEFDACFTGIYGLDNNNFVCSGNTFNLRRPDNYTAPEGWNFRSVYMEGGKTAFVISENSFINAAPSSFEITSGTDVLSAGTMNHSIFSNDYRYLYVGNRAQGLNASSDGLMFSGLMYECNNFEQDALHDNWVPNGSIRFEQGRKTDLDASISSGNRYNEIFGEPLAQQFTNLGSGIEYHHIVNTSQELVEDFFTEATIDPIPSAPNTACDDTECPPPCDTENELAAIKSQFFQEKQTWTTKTAAFPAITNQVQRQSEADAINRLRLSLDRAGSRILLHHTLDTTSLKTDSILTWLGHLETYDADLKLARYHFFKSDFSTADSLLQIIPSRHNLSGELLDEFNDITAILEIIRPRLEAGIPLDALPETLIDSIDTNWGTDCSAAGALARNILYRNGIRLFPDCQESQRHGEQAHARKKVHNANIILSNFRIYPNPANNSLTVERKGERHDALFRLTDIGVGRVYFEQSISFGTSHISLEVSSLPNGVYIISLIENGVVAGQGKLVIAR